MGEALKTRTVPLERGDDGAIRVTGTRVTLDSVHHAFQNGATAEEIAQQYPTLRLADVYQVIGHLLQHPADIREYLDARERQAQSVREANEAKWPSRGIRARLLARQRG
jgi:uncharacterized protein (DUF433 family)